MHMRKPPSFFLANKIGWLYCEVLGLIHPFASNSSIYRRTSASSSADIRYWRWWGIGLAGSTKSILCLIARSMGSVGSSNISLYSCNIFYQRCSGVFLCVAGLSGHVWSLMSYMAGKSTCIMPPIISGLSSAIGFACIVLCSGVRVWQCLCVQMVIGISLLLVTIYCNI